MRGLGNQDCMRTAVEALETNWSGIIAQVRQLGHRRPTIICTMDICNPCLSVWQAIQGTSGYPIGLRLRWRFIYCANGEMTFRNA